MDATELRLAANKAFAGGNYAEALTLYTQGLDAEPDNHLLLSNRSAAYASLALHDTTLWPAALADAERCIALQPNFIKGYNRSATALAALHRPGHAEAALRKGLEIEPNAVGLRAALDKLIAEEDGDQSKVRASNGSDAPLRQLQGDVGAAMDPNTYSGVEKYAFVGLYDDFVREWRPEHMAIRMSELRTPLLALTVLGAHRCPSQRHADIVTFLLDQGARIDGRDGAGYTAMGHALCTSGGVLPPLLELGQLLLRRGADPDARTRFGTTALHSAVMCGDEQSVRLLLRSGADPQAQCNDGVSPVRCAVMFPAVKVILDEALAVKARDRRQQKQKRGGSGKSEGLRQLRVPVSPPPAAHAAFASRKELAKRVMNAGPGAPDVASAFETQQGMRTNDDAAPMIIKIQVPLGGGDMPMLCYNEGREFQVFVNGSQGDAGVLRKLVKSTHKLGGLKAYFRAEYDAAASELVVHAEEGLLPAQGW